ncbi:MAG TPA: retroviral-like aspartic protease family protein [Gammaproteobacteria bacterium]|nr:retroviral-like aspartic protease family protein [Gammaproteobacteria bacterium]
MILAALAVFVAAAVPRSLWAACRLVKFAELPVTMAGLAPLIRAKIDGADAKLIADSGAFFSLLTPQSAARLGLALHAPPSGLSVSGVNGKIDIKVARARRFDILGTHFDNADFVVGGPPLAGGADGLLGQNMLNANDAEYDLADGVIRLFRPEDCKGAMLAYWAQGKPFSTTSIEPKSRGHGAIVGTGAVNGIRIRIAFDTGAARSILTANAARRAGVERDQAGVRAGGIAGGLGRRGVDTWIAPIASFRIGDEEIKNTSLRVGAIDLQDADMLIGADFFLSHRIYVANSQRKLYFTYNGGPVFRLDRAQPEARGAEASAAPLAGAPGEAPEEPKDAAGFSRRGAALAARRELVPAIAAFTRAIELEPNNPKHFYDRAIARLRNRQPALGMEDLDQALKLAPNDAQALLARGQLRLGEKDAADARVDFEAAARVNPNLHRAIAEAYLRAEMFPEAIGHLDPWIAAHSARSVALAESLSNRCWARAAWGRELDKALDDCNSALRISPRTSAILDNRGLVYLRRGDFRRAVKDYNSALKAQPRQAWTLYCRSLAERGAGDAAKAEADAKAALAINPNVARRAKRLGLTADAAPQGATR